jgi:spectinomycin phosphotransferase
VFGPPPIGIDVVGRVLADYWRLDDVRLEYAPVGFGSYHWFVEAPTRRAIVTLDGYAGIGARSDGAAIAERVKRAAELAYRLAGAGLEFVRGPVLTVDSDAFAEAEVGVFTLWPFLSGRSTLDGKYEDSDDRRAVLAVLAELHTFSPESANVGAETFEIGGRVFLEAVVESPGEAWGPGPYGERARRLVMEHGTAIDGLLRHYDVLATSTPPRSDWVITHGEPHTANVVFTHAGPVLIDWDTVKVAPRERDLWMVVNGEEDVEHPYRAATGHSPRREMLQLYVAQWELSELAGYFGLFHGSHHDGPDADVAWAALNDYLPLASRWPDI